MNKDKTAVRLPRKLYLEATTRCNLQCSKCIKQVDGSLFKEADFSYHLFDTLLPCLREVDTLILNGIGEPLLHPDLAKMIRAAKAVMADDALIGFQSNGVLLTADRAVEMAEAGANTICFSLDSLEDRSVNQCLHGPDVRTTARAIEKINTAAALVGSDVKVGLEIVVSRRNLEELPDLVRWAAGRGVDFVLVTHLFAYNRDMAAESIFELNTDDALDLFISYQEKAKTRGLELKETVRSILRSKRMVQNEAFSVLLQEMRRDAAARDIHLNFQHLLDHNEEDADRNAAIFFQAEQAAKSTGLDLRLPHLRAQHERVCPFIDENAAFINIYGEVMPCHFLWHSYPCMAGNDKIEVQARSFGNVSRTGLDKIWWDPLYRDFRNQVGRDEYSRCWSCPQSPCADVVNSNILDINDCHGSSVPCGHCRWSIGGLHCL